MADNNVEILSDAIARNAAAVLSLPSAGMLRHHKTRFLGNVTDGFAIESVLAERPLIDTLINEHKPVGISFKGPNNVKIVFTVPLMERRADFEVSKIVSLEALILAHPLQVKSIQRRGQYRVHLPTDPELSVRMWRIPEHWILTDKPMAAAEIQVRPLDVSIGGVGLVCIGKDGQPPRLTADERVRISITFHEDDVLVEGRVLHPTLLPNKTMKAGVAFKKLNNDIQGRQNYTKLTNMVGQLQRDEVRRMRLATG